MEALPGYTKEKFLTLSQISSGIREAISARFGEKLMWIVAEVSELNVRKGHCFLSLVEKLPDAAAPLCELKGIIWSARFEKIRMSFLNVTGSELSAQTRILFQARVNYDVKWGLSLLIEDIEPAYTLGLLKKERDQNVTKLKAEGIFEANRRLHFPIVPARIAVISAADSRGYEDFINKLIHNPYGYRYEVKLFSSQLQGDQAPVRMVERLIEIFQMRVSFDLVVIVRGGGGAVDLNCFNDYKLSRAVARFPLPVITGIGHTTNISIVDEVAYSDRITPTDAADFIVERTAAFETMLFETASRIRDACLDTALAEEQTLSQASISLNAYARRILETSYASQSRMQNSFRHSLNRRLDGAKTSLLISLHDLRRKSQQIVSVHAAEQASLKTKIAALTSAFLNREQLKIDHAENATRILDPVQVLRRGYSITRKDGHAIRKSADLKQGDIIKTQLYEGSIESEVRSAK